MSVPVILRAAPIATFEELSQPDTVRHFEMYERGSLKPRPGLDSSRRFHPRPRQGRHSDRARDVDSFGHLRYWWHMAVGSRQALRSAHMVARRLRRLD